MRHLAFSSPLLRYRGYIYFSVHTASIEKVDIIYSKIYSRMIIITSIEIHITLSKYGL